MIHTAQPDVSTAAHRGRRLGDLRWAARARRFIGSPWSVAMLVALAACGQGGDDDTSDDDTTLHPVVIGPDGGAFTLGEVVLDVPPGAFTQEVSVSIVPIHRDVSPPWELWSPVWELNPAGLPLNLPIAITMPYTASGARPPRVGTPGSGPGGYDPQWPYATTGTDVQVLVDVLPREIFVGALTGGFDEFIYEEVAADLLFVIDDSCSMFDHQNQLASILSGWINILDETTVKWRFGVVTTDTQGNGAGSRGRLVDLDGRRWTEWDDADRGADVSSRVTRGTSGSAFEQPLEAIRLAVDVQRDEWNAGFFRTNAHLASYVLTDEVDQSPAQTRASFVTWYPAAQPTGDVSFHAIVGPVQWVPNCMADPGTDFLAHVANFGGAAGVICHYPTWPPALLQSLQSYAAPLYSLSLPAAPGSVRVDLVEDGQVRALTPDEFSYLAADNAVLLRRIRPVDGARINIQYEVAAQ